MWLAAVLITIIISIYFYVNTKKPKNFPPGPAWLPIIGCALQVEKYRQKMRILSFATAQMAKDYSGGEILGLKVGNELQVIVNSIEGYKEMSTNHKLDGRPTGLLYTSKSYGLRRGIVLTDEEFWQEQSRFLVRHLREFGFNKNNAEQNICNKEISFLIKYLNSLVKKSINGVATVELHHVFDMFIVNSILTIICGLRFDPDDVKMQELQQLLAEVFASANITGCLFHFFPILRYIAPETSGYSKYMYVVNKGTKACQELINEHKETYKPGVTRDFIDAYIKEILDRGHDTSTFSESQLIAIFMDLFIAGSDTSSKALCFGFLHFLRNPDVMKKAQEEMDYVVGRERLPTLNDKPNLPYTDACVYETLRIFSGLGLGIPHRALADTTLLGYFIPKDTTVVMNHVGLHMDEKIWEDPWCFKPERFLDVDGKVIISSKLIPFGLGRRRCMGENFAKNSLFLFISNILHTFDIKNPEGAPLPDPFPVEGILPSAQPYEAEISLRCLNISSDHDLI